jgi:hypothetical protein
MGTKKASKVDPGAFDPGWLEVGSEGARAAIDAAMERSADLVEAWVARKNVPAVLEIAMDDGAPALARKAARRGINVLKSRGVAIPERPHAAASGAGLAQGEILEAWFRPPDGAGTSAFTLGSRSRDGRYKLVDVILKEGVGLVSIAGMQMSRSQLRDTFDGIAKRFGHPPASVPMAWARARIARASLDNDKSGTPPPLGIETHRDLLGPPPASTPPHPIEALKLPSVPQGEALDRSAKLHAEAELRGWLPAPPAIQDMLNEVGRQVRPDDDAAEPGLTQRKVREVIEKATDSFFTRDARLGLAERMRDAAISMASRGARDRAADLVVTADAVGTLEEGLEPHAVPFLRAFFEKAFGLATARAAAQKGP